MSVLPTTKSYIIIAGHSVLKTIENQLHTFPLQAWFGINHSIAEVEDECVTHYKILYYYYYYSSVEHI